LPRPRSATAPALVGQHAERGPALPLAGALDGALSWADDLHRRHGAQRPRRRAPRRARSEARMKKELSMNLIWNKPVTSPKAWRGDALQNDQSWIVRLTDAAIAEIDRALPRAQGARLARAA